jgi:hypothetical protein
MVSQTPTKPTVQPKAGSVGLMMVCGEKIPELTGGSKNIRRAIHSDCAGSTAGFFSCFEILVKSASRELE